MRETIQNANGKQFHAVSLSGGKDSTAMLLLMIERDMPINMVLSADTGMGSRKCTNTLPNWTSIFSGSAASILPRCGIPRALNT